ncbi:MAG: hypothetical protein ACJASV_001791 [Pseudorhodobacter sp.]|jgi:hypothetical protein
MAQPKASGKASKRNFRNFRVDCGSLAAYRANNRRI